MLRIIDTSEEQVPCKVGLNEKTFGQGLTDGIGFSFYSQIKDKLSFLTFQVSKEPILTAVSKEQYKKWKNQAIIGIPGRCVNAS